jgi:hypothetical protein
LREDASAPGRPGVVGVLEQMQRRLDDLPSARSGPALFLRVYQRTTAAVGEAMEQAWFEDAEWVDRWGVAFARLYLDALDAARSGARVPAAWQRAFEAPLDLPDLLHVLLGMNAHINFDLPQSLLEVISAADFEDPALMDLRRRDHERIDRVLASRVAVEAEEYGSPTLRDRLLLPLNRLGTRRFLKEARRKVWHNTYELHAARLRGSAAYDARVRDLEMLSAAKIADLLRPGQVLLRLSLTGFGVSLPPSSRR